MPRELQPCVYILASRRNGTLYTGVTANLIQRLHEHREGTMPGFTRDYGVKLLVWFENRTRPWSPRLSAKSGSRNGTASGRSN